MNRTKWDKVIAFVVLAASILSYAVDELVKDWIPDDRAEFKYLIVFIGALSMFAGVWSFIWDNKVARLHEELSSHTNALMSEQKQYNSILREAVFTALIDQDRIESRVLSDHEDDLETFLQLQAGSSHYAQIFIITNDSEVETSEFGDAICRNIIRNHQYIYMTNLSTRQFKTKLYQRLIECIPDDIDKYLLQAAFAKNVNHISKSDFFTLLPEYSDMAVYTQNRIISYGGRPDIVKGYYAFQNGAIKKDEVDCYYYTQMPDDMAKNIATTLRSEIDGQWDSSKGNYTPSEVEIRTSPLFGKGCFAKHDIPKGKVVFMKGGRFILKDSLEAALLNVVNYIQISDQYVLSSLNPIDDTNIGLQINHSCHNFNCGFVDAGHPEDAISIIATRKINAGEELLIDYAFFDPDYKRFHCNCCAGKCSRISQTREEVMADLTVSKQHVAPYLRSKL